MLRVKLDRNTAEYRLNLIVTKSDEAEKKPRKTQTVSEEFITVLATESMRGQNVSVRVTR